MSSTRGEPRGTERSTATDGYHFLLHSGLPTAALLTAIEGARRSGVSLPNALLAEGIMDEATYATLVGAHLAIPVLFDFRITAARPLLRIGPHQVREAAAIASVNDRPVYVMAASAGTPEVLASTARAIDAIGGTLMVSTSAAMAAAIERADRAWALRRAIHGLRRIDPDLSASRPPPHWQKLALAIAAGLFIGGAVVMPAATVYVLLVLLLIPFLAVVVVRSAALAMLWRAPSPVRPASRIPDDELPAYSILVPLFDERAVVPSLVAALRAMDYPASKLDVTLVLEEVDLNTKLALLEQPLPPNFRLIVVPDSQPRTKPKALNYAMQFVRGDFVVVYDAEDRPEPDQLRKAVAAFRAGSGRLACLQARLNIYNPFDSWFSRQFTAEYSALFDAILPALAWANLPVPLGGTSNHFPRAVLEAVGGWDPFNVTEDADLGIRLARLGYTIEMLDSTTWEEAPVDWSQWLPQRTRWLKGWYQTFLVHNRKPGALIRDLGLRRTLGFQIFLGGVILSTLVHPFAYVLLAGMISGGNILGLPSFGDVPLLWYLALATLALGYASAIAVGLITVQRRHRGLWRAALTMPLCWLLISLASYRALWQLWHNPFLWEKTRHGAATTEQSKI